LESPFQDGVRYLSTKEEVQAVHEASKHISRARTVSIAQAELPKEEPESVAFLAAVRRDIDKWLESGQKTQDYLNIPSRNAAAYSDGRPAVTSLNRYQKRLVHQLVETEYPSLTSIGRADFIKIVNYDEEREESIRQQKVRRLENRLLEHRGFRWIIEALTGGDALSQLESKKFEPLVLDGADFTARRGAIEDFATNIKARLQSKKRRSPVVGHNLFLDLVYLWQCFYGDLPDRVEEFIQLLHAKFPVLIDTKYIFTHECGDMNPVASLDIIDEACKHITNPEISERKLSSIM
jgi:poly(A)-specific ribonuclease